MVDLLMSLEVLVQVPKVWEVNCRCRVSNAGFNVKEYKCVLQKSGISIAGSASSGIIVQISKVQKF